MLPSLPGPRVKKAQIVSTHTPLGAWVRKKRKLPLVVDFARARRLLQLEPVAREHPPARKVWGVEGGGGGKAGVRPWRGEEGGTAFGARCPATPLPVLPPTSSHRPPCLTPLTARQATNLENWELAEDVISVRRSWQGLRC